MKFPAIIVERPHQRQATVWVAYSERDIVNAADCLADKNRNGAFNRRDEYADEEEIRAVFGDDFDGEGMADVRRIIAEVGYPVVEWSAAGEDSTWESASTAPSQLKISLACLSDDLHAMDVLESPEDFARAIVNGGHNFPESEVEEAAIALGWAAAEEEE